MNFELNVDRSNFLLLSIASLFGLIVIVIAFYIYTSRDADTRQKYFKRNSNNNLANNSVSRGVGRGVGRGAGRSEQGVSANDIGADRIGAPANGQVNSSVPVGFRKKKGQLEKQVFNISNNIYTYDDAEAVCKAFGAELADYHQLKDSYQKGADWCNYGWTKGQMALYPTQYSSWLKMQENEPERRGECGSPGINGGYFENSQLQFGVNCYGVKPTPKNDERTKTKYMSDKEIETQRKVAQFRSKLNDISVLPFNKDKWSSCN